MAKAYAAVEREEAASRVEAVHNVAVDPVTSKQCLADFDTAQDRAELSSPGGKTY